MADVCERKAVFVLGGLLGIFRLSGRARDSRGRADPSQYASSCRQRLGRPWPTAFASTKQLPIMPEGENSILAAFASRPAERPTQVGGRVGRARLHLDRQVNRSPGWVVGRTHAGQDEEANPTRSPPLPIYPGTVL
jgi:hypothetical protein